jgi:hypothetical protein
MNGWKIHIDSILRVKYEYLQYIDTPQELGRQADNAKTRQHQTK